MNEALSRVVNPEIHIDTTRSFTAYVFYDVKRDVPDDILELFELVDGDHHRCKECPHYVPPTDKRRKWGSCNITSEQVKADSPACEHFYLLKYKSLSAASKKYRAIPYTIE
jgi:hypothetical protein